MKPSLRDGIRADWWSVEIPKGQCLDLPGIYEWRIGERFLYIGKSKALARRIREYPNNVRKLIAGQAYRKSNPNAYRPVHIELRRAHDALTPVTVAILENCEVSALNERERHWIALRNSEEQVGGRKVLNAV